MYQGGLTPVAAYKAKVSAAQGTQTAPGASQYEQMLHKLAQFKRYLKGLKATSAKEAAKRDEILPELKPYVDGVLASDDTAQNDVLVHYMIWSFDAGNIDDTLKAAEKVIPAGMSMPEGWSRDAIDWFADAIAEKTIEQFDIKEDANLDNTPFDAYAIIKGQDITDEPMAKLQKAMGHVLHFKEPKKAIEHYSKAYKLWKRSGTKKLADNLQKQLESNDSK